MFIMLLYYMWVFSWSFCYYFVLVLLFILNDFVFMSFFFWKVDGVLWWIVILLVFRILFCLGDDLIWVFVFILWSVFLDFFYVVFDMIIIEFWLYFLCGVYWVDCWVFELVLLFWFWGLYGLLWLYLDWLWFDFSFWYSIFFWIKVLVFVIWNFLFLRLWFIR